MFTVCLKEPLGSQSAEKASRDYSCGKRQSGRRRHHASGRIHLKNESVLSSGYTFSDSFLKSKGCDMLGIEEYSE